jgi:uncharacterized membrane protein YphA (DoxX/SURF4 family)
MADSFGLDIVGLAASIGVGLIFVTTGWAKVRHRALLEGVVANYRILPQRLVAPVARLLPGVEMVTGVALIAGLGRVPALAATALLLAFAAAMAVNVRRGRLFIDCGCGLSHLRQHVSWALIARNGILAALLVPTWAITPTLSGADVAIAAFGGIALFLTYQLFNALDALSQSSAAAYRRSAS